MSGIMAVVGLVVISAIGTAVVEVAKTTRLRRLEQRGALAGWWWQVTHPPSDPDMAGSPWSIELIEVRHNQRNVSVEMFRVRNPTSAPAADFSKRWRAEGRYNDIVVDGHYWAADDGNAGHGTFHLWRISGCELRGEFSESKSQSLGMSVSFVWDGAPLRWVRVGATEEAPILELLASAPPPVVANAYPRKVHLKLNGALLSHPVPSPWWRSADSEGKA